MFYNEQQRTFCIMGQRLYSRSKSKPKGEGVVKTCYKKAFSCKNKTRNRVI